jgi:hypothetical protein
MCYTEQPEILCSFHVTYTIYKHGHQPRLGGMTYVKQEKRTPGRTQEPGSVTLSNLLAFISDLDVFPSCGYYTGWYKVT